jgi:hypothetical protein
MYQANRPAQSSVLFLVVHDFHPDFLPRSANAFVREVYGRVNERHASG